MRIERPNAELSGQIDLFTRCDNPACGQERYDGYTAPWMMLATFGRFEWDGWLKVRDTDTCSWACLAIIAQNKTLDTEAV